MSTSLDTFLAQLKATLGAVIPDGSSTPIGSSNVYTAPPTASFSLPAIVIYALDGNVDEIPQQQGRVCTPYEMGVYLMLSKASGLLDLSADEANARPYLVPIRYALHHDPQFNDTASYSELKGYGYGRRPFHDGLYNCLRQGLYVEIWEVNQNP